MDVRGVVSCDWSSGNIPIYVRYGIPSAPLCTLQMNLLIIAEALILITDRVEDTPIPCSKEEPIILVYNLFVGVHFEFSPYNVKNIGRFFFKNTSLPVISTFNSANKKGRHPDHAARQRLSPPRTSE